MLFALIIIFIVYLLIFYNLKEKPASDINNEELKISVIVAAKNEEKNLEKLIISLSNQNYPFQNYEVIIVDDNSTDSTLEIANKLITENSNFRIIKALNKKYEGKRGALQIGIEAAEHENIIITDADCSANKGFIKSFSSEFNKKFDFIFGVSPFVQTNSMVNNIACFDNLWVHILTFSFANIGLPYSAAARSFGFNKKSFIKIEGFKNTIDTLSGDDDLLLREAVKNNLKVGTILKPYAFVFTDAKNTMTDFIKQKSRHTSTSNYYSLNVKIVLGLWHIVNILMLFSLIMIYFDFSYSYLFIVKMIGDIFIVKYLMKTFSYNFRISQIILLQIIYEVLLTVNYIRGSFIKEKW